AIPAALAALASRTTIAAISSLLRLMRRLASAIRGSNEKGRRRTHSVIKLLLLASPTGVKSSARGGHSGTLARRAGARMASRPSSKGPAYVSSTPTGGEVNLRHPLPDV